MSILASRYRGYRVPPEIISHCVWLYFRFSVSYRNVEELMAERGVTVTYETIRTWCERFAETTPSAFGLDAGNSATHGIWTRLSSRLAVACSICGVLLIRMVAFSTFSSSRDEVRKLLLGSSGSFAGTEECAARRGDGPARQLPGPVR